MHDADKLCNRVAFIVDGVIKLIDSPHDLKLQNGKRKLKIEYQNGNSQLKEFDLDNLGGNKGFLDIINKYKILSMHSEEASLEDIFIKVTGRSLS